MLDVNVLAEGSEYLRLAYIKPSPNHRLLAYAIDLNGSEDYTIFIKNIETGELLSETISRCYISLEWTNDSKTFYYNTLDERGSHEAVFRHRIGTDPKNDKMVYRETDDRFFVYCSKLIGISFLRSYQGNHQSATKRKFSYDNVKVIINLFRIGKLHKKFMFLHKSPIFQCFFEVFYVILSISGGITKSR